MVTKVEEAVAFGVDNENAGYIEAVAATFVVAEDIRVDNEDTDNTEDDGGWA